MEDSQETIGELKAIIAELWPRASFTMGADVKASWIERLREAGVDVGA